MSFRHHDLIVLGVGSGNAVITDGFADLDVALVADGPFGGTCLNTGCIPSKMLVHTAEVAETVRTAARFGVDATLLGVRWRSVRDRVFDRLDAVSVDGRRGREEASFVTVYSGTARFVGARRLEVDGSDGTATIGADQIVLATGSRPVVPPVVADSGLPFETTDSVMRIDDLPDRLAVLGGGYIAAELATVFSAFGVAVTIIEQESGLLSGQDKDVAATYTRLAGARFDLRLGTELVDISGRPGALQLRLDDESELDTDLLLVATGRRPNGDRLDLDTAGVATHDDGRIVVDQYQRTTADGVFALGDACTPVPLKHMANREADVVSHNLRHPDDLRTARHDVVPAAIFTQPQIASVGATEQECQDRGAEYRVGKAEYPEVAYGWALEDENGFCKVLAEPSSGRVLGAHVIGPHASTLIQPFVLAMTLGIDARTVVRQPYWIHPAPVELVQNALLDLKS
jgi:mycothione reductase